MTKTKNNIFYSLINNITAKIGENLPTSKQEVVDLVQESAGQLFSSIKETSQNTIRSTEEIARELGAEVRRSLIENQGTIMTSMAIEIAQMSFNYAMQDSSQDIDQAQTTDFDNYQNSAVANVVSLANQAVIMATSMMAIKAISLGNRGSLFTLSALSLVGGAFAQEQDEKLSMQTIFNEGDSDLQYVYADTINQNIEVINSQISKYLPQKPKTANIKAALNLLQQQKLNQEELIKFIKEQGYNFNATDEHGSTLLIEAIRENDITLSSALRKIEGINFGHEQNDGYKALDFAVKNNNFEAVKDFILKGDAVRRDKVSADGFVIENTDPRITELLNLAIAVQNLRSNDKEIIDIKKVVMLMNGVFESKVLSQEEAFSLLEANKIDINSQDKYGKTMLIEAAYLQYEDVVKLLLKNDASANINNNRGNSIFAFSRNNEAINELLLNALLKEGHKHFENKDFKSAIQAWDKAVGKNPKFHYDDVDFQYKFGQAHGEIDKVHPRLGHLDSRQECWNKVFELDPNYKLDSNYYFLAGSRYHFLGNYEESIKIYQKAIKIYPDNADHHHHLGQSLFKSGDIKEAIKSYQKAIEISANSHHWPFPHLNLGDAYLASKNYKEAIKSYQKAIESMPRDSEAYNSLGEAYHSSGNYKEAIKSYKKVITHDHRSAVQNHKNLAASYYHSGNYKEAIKAYQNIIEMDPSANTYSNKLQLALLNVRAGNNNTQLKAIGSLLTVVIATVYFAKGLRDKKKFR